MKVYKLEPVSGQLEIQVSWYCDVCYRVGQISDRGFAHVSVKYHGDYNGHVKDSSVIPLTWILVHHNHLTLHICSDECLENLMRDTLGAVKEQRTEGY